MTPSKDNKELQIINFKFDYIAIICICFFAFAIVEKTLQNDTYYTIALGKQVLSNWIDMKEHFSWHEGLIYTYPHWLYDIVIYLFYKTMGFNGVYISTVILSIFLGIAFYYTTSKLSKNRLVSFIFTLAVLFFGRGYITARAQLVSFILFILEIYNIEQFIATKRKRNVIGLIIIPIAIANIHAAVFPVYFVFYLPYIAEYLIAVVYESDIVNKIFLKIDKISLKRLTKKDDKRLIEKIEKIRKRIETNEDRIEYRKQNIEERKSKFSKIKIEKNNNVKWLILIMIICIFTGLITPIGNTPYTYLYNTMKGNTTQNINEHLPIVLFNDKKALIYIALIIFMITFSKVKVKLSDLFLIAGVIFLTIVSRRQLSLLLFIGSISVAKVLDEIFNIYDENGTYEMIKYATTIFGQIIILALIVTMCILLLKNEKKNPIVNDSSYPVAASNFILENLDISKLRMYNDYNYGSYLLYRGIPVFIDSRADVYDPKFNGLEDDIFQDYISITNLNCDYEKKFEHYKINYVMTYKDAKLNYGLSRDDNYKEIYSDKNFIIYERLSAKIENN